MLARMSGDNRNWAGKVLRFAVSGALLVAPIACGGSSEEHTVNEPGVDTHTVNEPPDTTGGEGGGEQTPTEPEPPHTNEPAPSE